jgi:hypothetical protein
VTRMPLTGIIKKSSAIRRQQFKKSLETLDGKHVQPFLVKRRRQYQYICATPIKQQEVHHEVNENVLFSDKEQSVDLYCHESMPDIFKPPLIMLNEKDEEIARIVNEVKIIFHSMKQNQEYDFITSKRQMIMNKIMQMHHDSRGVEITQAVVISSVFLMDWICAHNLDYFCEENSTRISCFCILNSMERNEENLHMEPMYAESCKLIYGDMTDKHLQDTRKSKEILEGIVSVGKYRESSCITLLNIYNEYIDDEMYELLVNVLFQTQTVEMKYRFTDIYEEFVESVIRNSKSTSLNFEIMHDYTTAISQ